MGQVVVRRLPRRLAPALPTGEIVLDPPPELPTAAGKGWNRIVTLMPMAAGGAAMGLMMGAQRGGPLSYVAGGMYGVSMLGMIASQLSSMGGSQSKRDMAEGRRQYLRRLSQQRAQVLSNIRRQREALGYRHPDPEALWSTVSSGRLWERRRRDADFGVVRVGRGPQELATPLVPPQTRPVDELEPLCAAALRKFVATYSVVPDLPVAIALRDFAHVYLRGPARRTRANARAMLAQLATFHAPDDLVIAFCLGDSARGDWDWAKWLPHAQHAGKTDAVGPLRLFSPSVTALEAMLDDVLGDRGRFNPADGGGRQHVVVVIDGGSMGGSDHLMTDGGMEGVTLIDLSNPPPRLLDDASVLLDVADDGTVTGTTLDGSTQVGIADELSRPRVESLARELSPLRLSAASAAEQTGVVTDLGLAELLELGDPFELDISSTWVGRPTRDRLRVPIGVNEQGRPIELDLKESALDGMGPHGLLVGATGSGKSELLRTLVLALAVTHSPEILNFVLVDFKGGATFATLDRLPHTSAMITNLEEELSLVDRMLGAISGELTRRQELLRRAGNFASQRDYERARLSGVPLAPLPSLLIIVDEFSELLTLRPDFIEMFVQIGRVGRSLGIHLLLASQRLEEGRLRGLETHLSYRIGLRTFSSMESRAVLGVTDAYELPRLPGHGYIKAGVEGLIRFKAAYVSGRYRKGGPARLADSPSVDPVRAFSTWYAAAPGEAQQQAEPEQPPPGQSEEVARGDSLLDILVDKMEGQGVPAHQVWLPPLVESSTLDELIPGLTASDTRGLTAGDPALHGNLQAVVGIVDRPFDQRRDPMWLDLSGSVGNVVVVGGPQSGKSTLLRSLVASMALTHTPREVQFYCLDFGGGTFAGLRDLPHVGGVANRRDVDKVRRTVAELYLLLQRREVQFAEWGVDSVASFRRMLREDRLSDEVLGDVFLVVDGWSTVRTDFEDLEPQLLELAGRGLGFGIHVVTAATRWMEVRSAVRDLFGTKIELRLGETSDSVINRRAAVNVPELPGHGLTPDGLHFLGTLPRIDGRPSNEDLSTGVATLVTAVRDCWPGTPAPGVRLLPDQLPYESLPQQPGSGRGAFAIGVAEADLSPVVLDFDAEPHAMLFGDVESGKSSFLRGLARSIATAYEPSQARMMLIDYRRSLLGVASPQHLIGYGTSAQVTTGLIDQVVAVMKERLPGPDVTPEQLRARSWWKGPQLYVLVDDYDLVAAGAMNPLTPLLDFLAQGRDIGLHLVVARRVGGAARAVFDPVVARIRELASPGILLSGPREEGAIFGQVKPRPLPPGRAQLVTRREGARLIQLAWTPPAS
ncbi:type VII secretion protein EccCa [Dactylosporangium sp. NPDC048998]|uniref:type VII secretion protein EccCa n=1 Tax=Dactylosporangium sp. NPDC048998 TaxID=3363976 RepID=UPI00371E1C2F